LVVGISFAAITLVWVPCFAPLQGQAVTSIAAADPNASCAPCHRAVYERYRKTPMANASGIAAQGFIPADLEHGPSGVHYKISEEADRVWLDYERDDPARPLHGRVELRYFIGSGRRGRTFLFEREGYWFEAPINWYSKKQVWDMAPNYLDAREMPLTMPVDPGCLHCHTSGAVSSLPDARNHYAGQPFTEAGITCVACHGDSSAHLASGGKTRMLNIDQLEAVRRDSVCLNCHLEGQAAVDKFGKQIENFAPGENLFDYTLFFTYKSETGSGGRATSQYEALLKSACMRQSGGKLTCTTCHDPHGSPAPEERVAFYRQRCLQCHAPLAQQHHEENPDCTACHMARPPSNDIAHEQVTDHWIRKRVNQDRLPLATTGELVAVGPVAADHRDLALAYAQMAERGDQAAGPIAIQLLRKVEQHAATADQDHELHAQLGFLEQLNGQTEIAAGEYRKALAADPYDSLAAGDLALIQVRQHHPAEAVRLWSDVLAHNPAEVRAAMNLAIVECAQEEPEAALATLDRILLFAQDDAQARLFAGQIRSGKQNCGVK
jgi:predicted CXXCH cytochrome family protein